jgi:hypothetical protein
MDAQIGPGRIMYRKDMVLEDDPAASVYSSEPSFGEATST